MLSASEEVAQALIVVDLQQAFVSGDEAVPAAASVVRAIERLMQRARAAGAVVVHLQNDGTPGSADEAGTSGWQLVLAVEERDQEHVIRKRTDDGFRGTELESILRAHGVRRVVMSGLMSEMCVSATARAALDLGWGVVLSHDAHATYDIPAVDGLGGAVPHEQVSRVAEWALGDQISVAASADHIRFERPRATNTP